MSTFPLLLDGVVTKAPDFRPMKNRPGEWVQVSVEVELPSYTDENGIYRNGRHRWFSCVGFGGVATVFKDAGVRPGDHVIFEVTDLNADAWQGRDKEIRGTLKATFTSFKVLPARGAAALTEGKEILAGRLIPAEDAA